MGYRSTFVTEDIYLPLPDWFVDKWPKISYGKLNGKSAFPLASIFERKFYAGAEDPLFIDIAKVLEETTDPYVKTVRVALLHEDGELDRVIISANYIRIEGSLKYDSSDCYNSQLGGRNEEYKKTEEL